MTKYYIPIIKWEKPIQITSSQYQSIKHALENNPNTIFWKPESAWEDVKGSLMGISIGVLIFIIGDGLESELLKGAGAISLLLTVPIGLLMFFASLVKDSRKNNYYNKMKRTIIQSNDYWEFKLKFYHKYKSPEPYRNSLGFLMLNRDIITP